MKKLTLIFIATTIALLSFSQDQRQVTKYHLKEVENENGTNDTPSQLGMTFIVDYEYEQYCWMVYGYQEMKYEILSLKKEEGVVKIKALNSGVIHYINIEENIDENKRFSIKEKAQRTWANYYGNYIER